MSSEREISYVAFDGDRRIACGDLRAVARAAKEIVDRQKDAAILVFDDNSGPVDLDLRGSVDDVLMRLPALPIGLVQAAEAAVPGPRGPGRPKLGWSLARSRCFRDIGNGWPSSEAALRWRCAGWWTKQDARTWTRTASGAHRRRHIGS